MNFQALSPYIPLSPKPLGPTLAQFKNPITPKVTGADSKIMGATDPQIGMIGS